VIGFRQDDIEFQHFVIYIDTSLDFLYTKLPS